MSTTDPFDDVSIELLRLRHSVKWRRYSPDVLPAWVAEMDFALALPIRETLLEAISRDDTGYPDAGRLPEAFAAFAGRRFGWTVEPSRVRLTTDVVTGLAELLRALTKPGDGVVINTPVYPPFLLVTRELGRNVVEVPLVRIEGGGRLDLDGLERAFADGARVYLLCHPQNPTGRSHDPEELAAVAALAARQSVTVVSDEIHAPMSMAGAAHVPYLTLGEKAVATGITVTSASKAWNLAGLKCALIVSGDDAMHDRLTAGLPSHLASHTGHLGVLASIAAFDHGEEWLDALVVHLDRNRALLGELLERHLPQVRYAPPQAGYLTWLDCRELGLGDDPSEAFRERGRVALSPGPAFGEPGNGFARLNIGTSSALLEEAVRRMASVI